MNNKYLNKQKGIILPVVLIFFSVLMLLSITFLSLSGNQTIQSSKQVDRTQAYYLAKSGVDTIANYLVRSSNTNTQEEIKLFVESLINDNYKFNVETGEVSVHAVKEGSQLKIISMGAINGVSSTASINLIMNEEEGTTEIISSELPKENIVIIDNNDNLTAIRQFKTVTTENSILGKLSDYPAFYLEPVTTNLEEFNTYYSSSINVDARIKTLNITSPFHIDIDSDIRTLVIDNLTIGSGGRIYIRDNSESGKGILAIYIKNYLDMSGGNNAVFGTKDTGDRMFIFTKKDIGYTPSINIGQHSIFYGNLFSYDTLINIHTHASIYGLIYAPTSTVTLHNQSEVRGTIVTNNLIFSGNGNQITMIQDGDKNHVIVAAQKITKPTFSIDFDSSPWN